MSATKNGEKNSNIVSDLLSDIAAEEPIARKESSREGSSFVPDEKVLATVKSLFEKTGAVAVQRAFPTDKDAKSATSLLLRHAVVVAEKDFPEKSVARKIVNFTDEYRASHAWAANAVNDQFRVVIQLTHKRQARPKTEAEAK